MRRKAVWGGAVALLVMMLGAAAPAAAQDRTADVAQAKADLQRAGVELTGACGAAKLTNLVAWRLRPQYGLLGKLGGFRAVLRPDGSCESGGAPGDPTREAGVASDYLIERGTWHGYDLLGDGGGRNDPHWLLDATPQGLEDAGILQRNAGNFIAPIDPSVYLTAAAAPPPVAPPPPIVVVPAPSTEGILTAVATLAARVEQLYALEAEQSRADGDAHAAIAQNVTDGRTEARPTLEAVKTIGGFTAKYILPAVGGWLTARHFQ
jgi:hypothetical protein